MWISFDLGIKNLAYCVLDWTSGHFVIRDWNVIDLSGSPELRCQAKIQSGAKKGQLCGRLAIVESDGTAWCRMHQTQALSETTIIKKRKVRELSPLDTAANLV